MRFIACARSQFELSDILLIRIGSNMGRKKKLEHALLFKLKPLITKCHWVTQIEQWHVSKFQVLDFFLSNAHSIRRISAVCHSKHFNNPKIDCSSRSWLSTNDFSKNGKLQTNTQMLPSICNEAINHNGLFQRFSQLTIWIWHTHTHTTWKRWWFIWTICRIRFFFSAQNPEIDKCQRNNWKLISRLVNEFRAIKWFKWHQLI